MTEDGTVKLRDGRTIGYKVYGSRSGLSVLFFHGTPGSRQCFAEDDPIIREVGLRLIAVDRPGYGASDPNPRRKILDFVDDIEQLVDQLKLARFGIISVSGGGPFAAACGFRFGPDRVERIILVASPSPPGTANVAGIALGNRIGILLGPLWKRARWLIRAMLRANAGTIRSQPERYFDQLARQMCPTDERIARSAEFRSNFHRELLEAYRNGVEGHVDETGILSDPWGFDPGAIKVPVEIWHGENDTLAPVAMGRAMHDLIPGSRLNVVPGRGHLLLDEEPSWRAVLQAAQGKIANA